MMEIIEILALQGLDNRLQWIAIIILTYFVFRKNKKRKKNKKNVTSCN